MAAKRKPAKPAKSKLAEKRKPQGKRKPAKRAPPAKAKHPQQSKPAKVGPPSYFDTKEGLAIVEKMFDRIAAGESVNKICKDKEMPSQAAFYRWIAATESKLLREKYARACEDRAESIFEGMLAIADEATNDFMEAEHGLIPNTEHIQRSRLRIDTRKWMLSKMAPKKYGDKLELDGNLNLGFGELLEARRRKAQGAKS